MNMRKMIVFLFLLFNMQMLCCAQKPGRNGYYAIKNIPESNGDERLRRFSEYPVEEQIDIYLYSDSLNDTVTPPVQYYLIVNGEKKIPAILRRIETESGESPLPRESLISALDMLDFQCHCLTQADIDVLTRSEMQVKETDSQGIRGFKERYSQLLQEIKLRHEQPGSN